MQETLIQSLSQEDSLEEGMATHSSIPARRMPMDRGAWWTTAHRVAKSWIWVKRLSTNSQERGGARLSPTLCQWVVQGPVSPARLLEMQNLGQILSPLNQNMHINNVILLHLKIWEALLWVKGPQWRIHGIVVIKVLISTILHEQLIFKHPFC